MAADPQPTDTDTPREPMQRMRVGVTGLAVVVLLVALCFAVASVVRLNVSGDNATVATANASGRDDEPLAQLGVAPPVGDNLQQPKAPAR